MNISLLINEHGKKYSPYMRGIVNHLPMAQMALYKMTEDTNRVEKFTQKHIKKYKLDPVKEEYSKCISIENCLGKRSKYESYLDLLDKNLNLSNTEEYISDILNKYDLGISSGLFHPLIRIKHAVEGYEADQNLIEEMKRAASYYITGYRQADIFKRKIKKENIRQAVEQLKYNKKIRDLINNQSTTGKKIRALYNDEEYLNTELLIDGNKFEKVDALLNILLPLYINTGNIIALHCITGLEALLGLEKYYENFDQALDIITTSIITHLMTLDELNFKLREDDGTIFSWDYILNLGSESLDVHNIKFTYSCYELSKKYPRENLKKATLKRIDKY